MHREKHSVSPLAMALRDKPQRTLLLIKSKKELNQKSRPRSDSRINKKGPSSSFIQRGVSFFSAAGWRGQGGEEEGGGF